MHRAIRHLCVRVATLALIGFLVAPSVFAIGVQPLRTEITVDPGRTATATIKVINSEKRAITAKPSIEIYTKNDLQGYPVREELKAGDPRDIRDWIHFSPETVSLPADSEASVTVTVTAPKNAAPGGRYASVVYEEETAPSTEKVTIVPRVASLLLVTVSGPEKRSGTLKSFTTNTVAGGQPFSFGVTFANTGNIHLKPTGTITLFDGETQLKGIAKYLDPQTNTTVVADAIPVNLAGGNVLPESERVFTVPWTEGVTAGSYTAKLSLMYAANSKPLTAETKFALHPKVEASEFKLIDDPKLGKLFSVILKNTGTTNEQLAGMITVTNDFEYKVAEITLPNDANTEIKVGAEKALTIPWLAAGKSIPAGSYTATLAATYGPTKTPLELTTTFGNAGSWIDAINWPTVGVGALVVAIVVSGGLFARQRFGKR